MQDTSGNYQLSEISAKFKEFVDYKTILEEFGLTCTDAEYYWQVGEIDAVQGWILHLSCVRAQTQELFRLVIPELVNDDVPFRLVKDSETAKMIDYANLGIERMGKIMSIYPKQHTDIVLLAHKLIILTSAFRGPAILTDRKLGGIVYTRYGSYNGIRNKENPADLNRYIYSPSGELVPDEYAIPFAVPQHLTWPFEAITDPYPKPLPKLWNNAYKPLFVVRQNVKGSVFKGIYMKSFLNVKYCIIKEGKMGMWEDEWGRDIQDRLQWQYDLCKDLSNDIPFPKIFDLFKMNDDMYLAMEFIKGKSIEEIVIASYMGKSWSELPKADKLKLCDYLIRIVNIIKKFHERGYVHRDISGQNFMIDKKDRIKLIDVELAYSYKDNRPDPAFKYGSDGFVSPEQDAHQVPTVYEDIFAIGGLITLVLTGIHPNKYNKLHNTYTKEQFLAVNNDEGLAEIVGRTQLFEPTSRPDIDEIIQELNRFYADVKAQKEFPKIKVNRLDDETLTTMINNGIEALGTESYSAPDAKWHSPLIINDGGLGVPQMRRSYLPAMYNGMTGIAYLTTFAAALDYDISPVANIYENSLAHLIKKYSTEKKELAVGLYGGWSGIALTFLEGMKAGLIPADEANVGMIAKAFENISEFTDLNSGVAGQGAALLQCGELLGMESIRPLLDHYVKVLLETQQSDGAWYGMPGTPFDKLKHPGLAVGAGGIVIFLMAYTARYPDEKVTAAARKGLSWMISQAKKGKDIYTWDSLKDDVWIKRYCRDIGIPGIALTFIYAYTHFKDPLYKEVATGSLLGINAQPVLMDSTIGTGLAGLGDVYLEAVNAFGEDIWQERADWIANLLKSTHVYSQDKSKYWITGINPDSPAELMTGFSGVLYFLLKYKHVNMFNNLLLP
ncbi:hypothetical protein DVR12_01925 [Chitinophaga silvatica]|uniref:Protein kinase domain-containing protein n=1 Tax=Chitinophaga silvatica TaxID=2282649 RepID=A0A3E1YGS8_9BACT|nr:lanthionine synthetase LanC family protein [Chitinophaga silvatica]RFS26568.1 hypothetical protein DVR12_01925 [Chitinophaga silvatica]